VTSTQEIFKEDLQADISPNPIQNNFQLSLSGVDFQRGRIDFFDVNGRMIYLKILLIIKFLCKEMGCLMAFISTKFI
jgi:hypothetical protein